MTKTLAACLIAIIACSAALHGSFRQEGEPAGELRPCVVFTGAHSKVTERGYQRITSREEWATLWLRHKGEVTGNGYNFYYNRHDVPQIDFERYMVIAIFQGQQKNSAGLKAVMVTENPDRLLFRFDDKSFQTSGPDGGAEHVTVYGFFVLPRSTKALVLEECRHRLKGEPPLWQEVAAFSKSPSS